MDIYTLKLTTNFNLGQVVEKKKASSPAALFLQYILNQKVTPTPSRIHPFCPLPEYPTSATRRESCPIGQSPYSSWHPYGS